MHLRLHVFSRSEACAQSWQCNSLLYSVAARGGSGGSCPRALQEAPKEGGKKFLLIEPVKGMTEA
jgi:hypothetical protein